MPTSSAKITKEDINALADLMAEMDKGPSEGKNMKRRASASSKSRRPVSTAFPSRPSSSSGRSAGRPVVSRRNSRSSSVSRLSTHSSAVSIRSVASAQSAHGSVTPSMGAGEWSNVPPTPQSTSHHYFEGSSRDLDDYSTPQIQTTWSSPSSPSSPFAHRSPHSAFPPSPGRLEPRAPRNERTPLEDFAFLNDTGTSDGGSDPGYGGRGGGDDDAASTTSRSSNHSSVRSMRLRQEIEATAHLLRLKASSEGLAPSPIPAVPPLPGQSTRPASLQSKNSNGSANFPVFPSPGFPSPALPDADDVETRSVASVTSAASAPSFYGSSQATGSQTNHSSYGLTGREGGRERDSLKPRQRELKEWSQVCWIWQREKVSHGMLSKAPLIREVPAVMKRKMGKRDSAQVVSADLNFDDSKGKANAASKPGFGVGPTSSSKEGSWRKVTGVMRDDGYFRVFSEETVVLHSIHLPSILRTDVRVVDSTLFGRPNCLVIHRRQATPPTPGLQGSKSGPRSYPTTSSLASSARGTDDPLYICMPSIVAAQSWLVMAHCFARPEFFSSRGTAAPAFDASSAAESDGDEDEWEEVDLRCRIFRSIHLTINEGRSIGELGTEVVRPPPKGSYDRRPGLERANSTGTGSVDSFSTQGNGDVSSPARGGGLTPAPRSHRGESGKDDSQGIDTFCEISMDGDALARTSIRKGTTSPFWSESFTFSDLPSITQPLTIRIFQSHKSSRPTLVGSATVRVPDLPRAELVEDWWPVKPASYDVRSRASDTVGEISISVKVDEEVVLPSSEYAPMLELLNNDTDADLTLAIAHEFPSDLEEVSKILLRIYQSETQLISRLLRLADKEIDGDVKSAAILFRGNSILTKSVELYLRLVGAEYLDLSIGEPIRRMCNDKVEIEIDPSRMKAGVKEKDILSNVHALKECTMEVWNLIYSARERCPNEVRMIFAHIQKIVADKYGEEHKKMRSTSISAFIFLRFFVPAVLNPKLFSIVPQPPDPKAQRTLTLVAKTLQGLANFSTFGQKEPWMLPMNSFVQDNTSAFVDFIDNISTPSPNARFEWTSPSSASYLTPYRLRNSLAPPVREGVPPLPHLIDLPRDLGLLASHMARTNHLSSGASGGGDNSSTTSRASKSAKLGEFVERCVDVHEEAQRRGGGLVQPLHIRAKGDSSSSSYGSGRLRPRAATHRGGSGWSGMSSDVPPQTPPKKQVSVEELHIRNPTSTPPSSIAPGSTPESRRSHRSYTISGIPPRGTSLPPPHLSTSSLHHHDQDLPLPPKESDSGLGLVGGEGESADDTEDSMDEDGVFSPRKLDFKDAREEFSAPSPTSRAANNPVLPTDFAFPPRTTASLGSPSVPAFASSSPFSASTPTFSSMPSPSVGPRDSPETSPVDYQQPFAAAAPSHQNGHSNGRQSYPSASIPMSSQASQSSTNTTASSTGTATTVSTISSNAEVGFAHVVSTGRRPSTAQNIMQSVLGGGNSEDSFGGDGGGKRKGILSRMGRRPSTVSSTSSTGGEADAASGASRKSKR